MARTGNFMVTGDMKSLKVTGPVTLNGPSSVNDVTTQATASTFILQSTAPTTFTASGEPGQFAVTSDSPNTASSAFLYLCYASNTWARVVLSATAFN